MTDSINKKLACIIVCVLCIATWGNTLKICLDMGMNLPARADFRAFITAADMVAGGASEKLYSIPDQMEWQSKRFSRFFPIDEISLLIFPYPPWIATLLAPIGGWPIFKAYFAVLAVNIICLSGCLFFLFKLVEKNTDMPLLICLGMVCFPPVAWAMVHGQFTFWLLFGYLGTWYFFRCNNSAAAGMMMGILLMKPYLLFLPCIYFIFLKDWRFFGGLFVSTAIFLLLSLPVGGLVSVIEWLSLLKTLSQADGIYGCIPLTEMHTIRGIYAYLGLGEYWVSILWYFSVILIIIISFYAIRRTQKGLEIDIDTTWPILPLASLLIAPHLNLHDITLSIPGFMCIASKPFTYFSNRVKWGIIICLVILWCITLYHPIAFPGNLVTVTALSGTLLMLIAGVLKYSDHMKLIK